MARAGVHEGLVEESLLIGRVVVSNHLQDADAMAAQPGERAFEERGGVLLSLCAVEASGSRN